MSAASLAYPRFASAPTPTADAAPGPLTLPSDRRRSPRWSVSGHATAVVRSTTRDETRTRICPLQLVNISDTGAGVVCAETIAVGSQISVFVMPDGAEAGYDLRGTVVRCEGREDRGHTIGVRLATRLAA